MLDIIVPHYTEPWNVGKKFFDMLDLQRDVDFSKIRVLLVNDGEENALPDTCFSERHYAVHQINICHAGVSTARNAGLGAAKAEWVMFCDFDDMFAHVYALRDIMQLLPAPEFDMLWGELLIEDGRKEGPLHVIRHGKINMVFCHGKLYRRQFLLDNGMRFNPNLPFNEDSEFNAILSAKIDFKRTGKINAQMPPYIWCWRKDSTTNRPDKQDMAATCHYTRNKNVCEAYKANLPYNRYCAMVARTVWDAYYTLNAPILSPALVEMQQDFSQWYKVHEKAFLETDAADIPQIKAIASAECKRDDNRDNVSIEQWLFDIKNMRGEE